MSEQEESLAGELAPSGSLAWQRLHGEVSSQLTGRPARATGPPSGCRWRSRAGSRPIRTRPGAPRPTRASSKRGQTVAVPLAAALNGAKGELGVLNRRRGFTDDLEPALRANNVDRATLDAMTDAVVGVASDVPSLSAQPRRGCSATTAGLPWWDLFAPVGRADTIAWSGATDRVRDAFAGYSPELAALANRAFAEQWVDAETRDGKQGGAYCAGVDGDVSRIMMNFDGSQDSVSTLAHELGHAFHNVDARPSARRCNAGCRWRSRRRRRSSARRCSSSTPREQADDDAERLALLDVHLVGATQTVVDIHSRFLFETELCARRRRTTLSVADMNDRDARRAGSGVRRRPRTPIIGTSTCGR